MRILVILVLLLVQGNLFADVVRMRVSAYCPGACCCGKYGWGYKTASGYRIKTGDKFVAAPKRYPFGTKMLIPGYSDSPVIVKDRGGAIRGNRLDVYFDTHQEALNWGVKYIDVTIMKGD